MDLSKLIFRSNGHTSYVDVIPTDTLSDARRRILQDLDADQLPSSANNFAFQVNGVRISHAQEKKNLVVDILGRGARVELIPTTLSGPVGTSTGISDSSCEESRTGRSSAGSEQGSSAGCEGFACMDSSRSSISTTNWFRTNTGRVTANPPAGQETLFVTPCDGPTPPSTQAKLQYSLEGKAKPKASNNFDSNMPKIQVKTEKSKVAVDDFVDDVIFSTKENARKDDRKKSQGQKGDEQNNGATNERVDVEQVDDQEDKVKERRNQVVQQQNVEKPSKADFDALRPGSRVIVDLGHADGLYTNATVIKRRDNSDTSNNMIGNIWVQHDATAVKSLIPERNIIRILSRCNVEEQYMRNEDSNSNVKENVSTKHTAKAFEVKGKRSRDVHEASDSRKKGMCVDSVELKRTIEVVNLCASDDDGSKPAAMTSAIQDFTLLSGSGRKVYWSDKQTLASFFEKVLANPFGAECEVCAETGDVKRCRSCSRFFHAVCVDMSCQNWCLGCQVSDPQCHMCNQKGGLLLRTYAQPRSMKKWKANKVQFEQSLFGANNFCHIICGIFNPLTQTVTSNGQTVIHCSRLIMSDGHSHVLPHILCTLCGMTNGVKVKCDDCESIFHVTCARQAGLEVADGEPIRCFHHLRCQFVLRARLEDLMWEEKARWKDNSFKPDAPIDWNHAAKLLHFSINIMRTLGWAWRWAEWWVCKGDNWEPCICEGEKEEEMTDEELKRVWSTADSRCLDARRCRLSALGAALRNRDYDKENGDDQQPLERALTALLSTPSLVGPLDTAEIEFFTTWLTLAYRSKSAKLGFGVDKIPVAADGFCVHHDGSPKYELGKRTLPGKIQPFNGVFEPSASCDVITS